MHRWIPIGVLALVFVPIQVLGPGRIGTPSTEAAARTRFAVGAGDRAYWNGPHVENSEGGSCGGAPCWTYRLDVKERGYRLRIGIDHPKVGDVFEVEVFEPGGSRAASFGPGDSLYSAEYLEMNPRPGVWRIRVTARDVTDSAFRMRAKLETRAPRLGTRRGRVLPNLQVLPPHEASFMHPITNGSTGGPPQGIEGGDPCHPEERAEERAVRCLRFAYGIRNTGRGPMQVYYEGSPPQDHPLFQRVQRANGSFFDRKAGIARWHETHGHYHHHDAVALRLFRVTDRDKGTLEAAGDKRRKGFAHRDELLRDWRVFYPTWTQFGFGLLAGWSDIYEWDRPGNYVDFGLNPDGYYVVRMWADPVDGILESNEKDNVGYTYLRVTGSEVEPIEAGRGRHPWDPCKIVVGFGGYPDPRQPPRPARCPPDTI